MTKTVKKQESEELIATTVICPKESIIEARKPCHSLETFYIERERRLRDSFRKNLNEVSKINSSYNKEISEWHSKHNELGIPYANGLTEISNLDEMVDGAIETIRTLLWKFCAGDIDKYDLEAGIKREIGWYIKTMDIRDFYWRLQEYKDAYDDTGIAPDSLVHES